MTDTDTTTTASRKTDTAVNIGGRDAPAGMWRPRHAAAELGVSERTLERWRTRLDDRGRPDPYGPPFIRLRGGRFGRIFYRPGAVKEWLLEQEGYAPPPSRD